MTPQKLGKNRFTSDRAPTGLLPISFADLARLRCCARSTVTRAVRGPLAPALLPGGRIDRGHPAVRQWLGEVAGVPALEPRDATHDQFADVYRLLVQMYAELHLLRDTILDTSPPADR